MFGWKKYRFKFISSPTGSKGIYLYSLDGVYISYSNNISKYIPELAALKIDESVEIEIKIKGRK